MESISSQDTIELALTAIFVLISAMVLWKLSSFIKKGRKEPKKSSYFRNSMKERQNKL
ncbi:hypothetical protein [Parvicella tangerina]|uniref:Uncharacterized protein n=1 Tax=Parvicella tangerina TaxID=2829795 RepID=A0A916NAJ5_9FLAO|nr:hypothetical protein [Parvicella tangerina]CAG5079312.1 hypothetical protein CRYO30217_00913 [Parvicella tangerina]